MKETKSLFSRYIRMVVTGLAVLLVVEIGGLIYVDRSYLQESTGDTQVHKVTKNVSSRPASVKASIDSSATQVRASYDGAYLAYRLNGELKLLNLTSGQETQIQMAKGMELGYYNWVYDRNQLIIAEVSTDSDNCYAKLYNLNISESTTPEEIMNTVTGTGKPLTAKIPLYSKSTQVTDLDFSTSIVASYLKLTNKNTDKSTAWEFNLPNANKAYKLPTKNIGKIQCLKEVEGLLYENRDNGRVYVANEGPLSIDGEKKFRLLGYDGSDNIFLSKGDGTTATEILYGSIEKQDENGETTIDITPDFKKVTLPSALEIRHIYITSSGGIYYNDSANKVFKNLVTNKEVSYRGELLSVFGKGFVTESDGAVLQNNLD